MEEWRKIFLKNLNPPEEDKFPFVLFANKNDMTSDIKVTEEDIKMYCLGHNNMPYFFVSAKDGEGVEEGFNKVCDVAYKKIMEKEDVILPDIKPIRVQQMPEKKSRCPC